MQKYLLATRDDLLAKRNSSAIFGATRLISNQPIAVFTMATPSDLSNIFSSFMSVIHTFSYATPAFITCVCVSFHRYMRICRDFPPSPPRQPTTDAPTANRPRRPRIWMCATRSCSYTHTAIRPPYIAIWCDASKWYWRTWRPAWTRCSARDRCPSSSSSSTHQSPPPRRPRVPTRVFLRPPRRRHRRPSASRHTIITSTTSWLVPPAWPGTRPTAFAF